MPEAPRGVSKVDLTLSIDRDLVVSALAVAQPCAKVIELPVSDLPWRIRPKTIEELKKDREEKQRSSKAKEALLKYCHDLDEKIPEMKVSEALRIEFTSFGVRLGENVTERVEQVGTSAKTPLYPFIASPFAVRFKRRTPATTTSQCPHEPFH